MKTIILIATLLLAANAANYAVIVAGSNGFYNYRHQADACHAYHVLIDDGGFDPKNIILMSYNDVAKDPENPIPNTLFNKPTKGAGVDVNKGCVIDYQGNDVTAANYLSILKGDAAAMKGKGTGKVLTSTANDKVFLNFVDHGAAGLVAFPVGPYLYVDDLINTFKYMTVNKMYKELVYYMEACESGSMFTPLPTNVKIYAVSASSPDESSWGTYCPPDDVVNGVEIGSCLGDTFSINWMEDSDANVKLFHSRTLNEQFAQVKKLTTQSSAMQWGDLTFVQEPIGNFLGKATSQESTMEKFLNEMQAKFNGDKKQKKDVSTQIDSRDITLMYLVNKFKKSPTAANQEALVKEIQQMRFFDEVFGKITANANLTGTIGKTTNYECYRDSIRELEYSCGKANTYSMKYFKYLYEMCEDKYELSTEQIFAKVHDACEQTM